jgi:hypothetical protein
VEREGETWRRLKATFPPEIATHSTVQTFYVGSDGLLKRHDYNVEERRPSVLPGRGRAAVEDRPVFS